MAAALWEGFGEPAFGQVDISKDDDTIEALFADLRALVASLSRSSYKPTLINDGIDLLYDWTKDRPNSLRNLTNLFVLLPKQDELLNVILASSDSFVLYWLQDYGLKEEFYSAVTINNLGEDAARNFLVGDLLPRKRLNPDAVEAIAARWPDIFAVTSGNMGELIKVARDAKMGGIDYALNRIWIGAKNTYGLGRAPEAAWKQGKEPLPAWTRDQFNIIVQRLVASPDGCVPLPDLEDALGPGGKEAVRSLVDYNVLQLQLPSTTSPTRQGPEGASIQVCPRSTADLEFMREQTAAETPD